MPELDQKGLRVAPWDEHNQELVAQTHPPDWVNPKPAARYHLVVIGAGTAGLISAIVAAGAGARVALIERHLMGGDCLNYGCVPSKGILRAARGWHEATNARKSFGGPQVEPNSGDFSLAMERMRSLRAGISHHDSAARFRDLGIDVFLGEGSFVASDAVEVEGHRLRFRRAVIATGARAAAPPIPGLEETEFLTNESVFSLTELPARFAIVGAGPIGCEMAQAFARFGSEVHLIDQAPLILPREDVDAARVVQKQLAHEGIHLHLDASVEEIRSTVDGGVVTLSSGSVRKEIPFDEILIAAGRSPNVEGLGLEAAGVAYDRGGVRVDDRLRTSNSRIYACGDVASSFQFTHTADAQAKIVVQNALFFRRLRSSDLVVPWATYTSPELAHIGHTETSAREAGLRIDTITVPLKSNDRSLLDGDDEGFLRLHLQRGKDRILGGTLVAAHAGDLLAPLALAITHRIGLSKFASTILPYPTQAEIYRRAASEWQQRKLTPFVRRLLRAWMRLFS